MQSCDLSLPRVPVPSLLLTAGRRWRSAGWNAAATLGPAPRPATSAQSAVPQSLRGERTVLVPSLSPPQPTTSSTPAPRDPTAGRTRVAVCAAGAVLGARLPAVAVAAMLRVARIFEGQARGRPLRAFATLCAARVGVTLSLAPERRGWVCPSSPPPSLARARRTALPGGQVWQQCPGSWRGCPQARAGHSGLMFLQLTLPGPLTRRPH